MSPPVERVALDHEAKKRGVEYRPRWLGVLSRLGRLNIESAWRPRREALRNPSKRGHDTVLQPRSRLLVDRDTTQRN